jgi:membrane associated rhomboid family serine protease
VVTPVVFVVTLLCGVAQLVHRPLYEYVVRDPDRIGDGQWYRLLTGMFFQDGWAPGLVSNLILLALFGTLAERVFGRWRWLVLYFGCGWIGQLVSYVWLNPRGAGNSMCVAGLIGGLAMFLLLSKSRYGVKLPPQLLLFAVVVPVLSVVGTVLHDNHGIPALVGMLLVYLLPKPRASTFTA